MNFLFVDRILEFTPGQHAKGIKFVTASDPYLKSNAKSQTVLPSCIIGEALGQLTAWIVMHAQDFSKRPVAGIVDQVHIYRDVYVGETLLLNTEIETLDDQGVLYSSDATICGETVFSLRNTMGPLVPMADLIDPAQAREQFNMIYRLGVLSDPIKPSPSAPVPEALDLPKQPFFFDRILDIHTEGVTAQKNISLLAPYFDDHFPRKPVLPLTLLLEGNLELAHFFLQNRTDSTQYFRAVSLHKVRIKQFIFPGDAIVTTVHLKDLVYESIAEKEFEEISFILLYMDTI